VGTRLGGRPAATPSRGRAHGRWSRAAERPATDPTEGRKRSPSPFPKEGGTAPNGHNRRHRRPSRNPEMTPLPRCPSEGGDQGQTCRLRPHSTGPPLDQGHGVSLPSSFGDVLPSALAYSAFPPVSVCGTAFAACGGEPLRCGAEVSEAAMTGAGRSGLPTAPYTPDLSSRSRREGSHLSVRTRAQPAADPRSTSRRRAHSATVSPGLGAFRRSVHSFRQSPDCSPQYPLKPFGERRGVRTLGPYSPRSRTTEPRKPREFGGED